MSEFPDIFEQMNNENLDGNDNMRQNLLLDIPTVQHGGNFNHFITRTSSSHNNKFNSTITTYKIGFSENLNNFSAAYNEIKTVFESPHDKIRIVLYHDSLERPISIPFLKQSQLTAQTLIDSYERVAQSYKDVKLNENNNLSAHVIIARLPSGSGARWAIIIGKAYADNDPFKTELSKPYSRKLDQLVIKVVKELYLPNQPCGLE
ncbi:unnamed protein product [Brachionus calyciflorus]|uniref:Uncharacterized protein n=1 Tax=Brachionus calyciflorus TaxID=104777 RepID=A0A814MKZ8_9BILA|nr:unnamed protein product [Brachionus calyciflorus]